MTLLRRYDTPEEAYIVQGMLKNYDIDSEVNANVATTVFPAPDAGIGSVDLYVADSDASRAEEILSQHGD